MTDENHYFEITPAVLVGAIVAYSLTLMLITTVILIVWR